MIGKIFNDLLGSLHVEGSENHKEEWFDIIQSHLEEFREDYNCLTKKDRDEIDYSNTAAKTAYIFAYAIGRSYFTYEILKIHRKQYGKPLFPAGALRISCVGGGPGSEVVGLVQYLLDSKNGEKVTSLEVCIFDKEYLWKEICESVFDLLEEYIKISLEYRPLDLGDKGSIKKISLAAYHSVFLSFIISELCALENNGLIRENIKYLFRTMSSGSSIFYNDSDAYSFCSYFNSCRTGVSGISSRGDEKSEVQATIFCESEFGETYIEMIEETGGNPHMSSKALSKFLVKA